MLQEAIIRKKNTEQQKNNSQEGSFAIKKKMFGAKKLKSGWWGSMAIDTI